ncbi:MULTISPECIES: nitrite reductase small subunit NirD [Paenibacillus]|jgi:nitrite reductase (NADH) small subunit|uniref:Nitrite reductase n=2 Tax=Paenibacillus TaxID=44249 RepID=A0A1R1ELF0_9BACL|nr:MULTISPECIES: nitrite reductase small subunit NirD [Paenibacillus]OMF52628.1 nitrite reductase [Paenibacillus rhizosphaerae]UYO06062.1 nitrite reductase small subunit NirD [Paenibacillus sp. PSB04]GIO56280.1 assimilatory nitrite reductase [NAD(P)H] small subunit [Paenibacillus cineris]GIO61958.1 assimilatory nitrite reductase [NAD(P)H] small subunit [Paenibacillus cineris]
MVKHLIGNIAEIDPKGSRTVVLEGTEIALFRLSDGDILAVENKCPHKGGKLSEGMVCGKDVHCPLHDWKIDLRSGCVQEPDTGKVSTYEVEVDPVSGAIYCLTES